MGSRTSESLEQNHLKSSVAARLAPVPPENEPLVDIPTNIPPISSDKYTSNTVSTSKPTPQSSTMGAPSAVQTSRRNVTGYLPIENYGLIGNMRTCALVGIDGSVDFMCW